MYHGMPAVLMSRPCMLQCSTVLAAVTVAYRVMHDPLVANRSPIHGVLHATVQLRILSFKVHVMRKFKSLGCIYDRSALHAPRGRGYDHVIVHDHDLS